MRVGFSVLRALTVAVVALWAHGHSGTAVAVDFSCPIVPDPSCDLQIFMSGAIKPGDAARFRDEVKHRGPDVRYLMLWNSSGGDMVEAMEIGRLVRKLRMFTSVSHASSDWQEGSLGFASNGEFKRVSQKEGLCAGACFLIWSAGINRTGNFVLALSKPSFAAEHFLELDEAGRKLKEDKLRQEVERYLAEMNVGKTAWLVMSSILGEDAVTLELEYLEAEASQRAAEVATWGANTCGEEEPPLANIDIPDSLAGDPIVKLWSDAGERMIQADICRTLRLDEAARAAWKAEFQ